MLYHLNHYQENLKHCIRSCRHMFLETEVLDSSDDEVVFLPENPDLYDQAFNGVGCRPSELHLENVLSSAGARFERCFRAELNAEFHTYDWKIENTKASRNGLRRAWFVDGTAKTGLLQRIFGAWLPRRRTKGEARDKRNAGHRAA